MDSKQWPPVVKQHVLVHPWGDDEGFVTNISDDGAQFWVTPVLTARTRSPGRPIEFEPVRDRGPFGLDDLAPLP